MANGGGAGHDSRSAIPRVEAEARDLAGGAPLADLRQRG
jgi:hypothetical protein